MRVCVCVCAEVYEDPDKTFIANDDEVEQEHDDAIAKIEGDGEGSDDEDAQRRNKARLERISWKAQKQAEKEAAEREQAMLLVRTPFNALFSQEMHRTNHKMIRETPLSGPLVKRILPLMVVHFLACRKSQLTRHCNKI